MKSAGSLRITLAAAALSLSACTTGYQSADALESAERGPVACARSCQDLGLRMSAFVLVGHDVSGCVCSPLQTPPPQAPPAQAPAPAPAPAPAAPSEPTEPPAPPTSSSSPDDAAGAAAAAYVVVLKAREAAHRAQLNNADSY